MKEFPAACLEQHTAVLGKTGSGKSYAVRGIVEGILDAKGRVCIVDPTGVWHGLRSSATGKSGGYPVVIFGGNHADLPLAGNHGETLAEVIGTSSTPAIIDTSLMKVGERTRFFADFADALIRKNNGPLHLVIDEAHLFAPQGKVNDPQSGAMLHAANNLVSLGRARGLRIILITQRPAKLHKDSLTQVETLVALRLIAPQDRHAVEDWIEDNADEAKGKEIIRSLASLKTGNGWVWAPELNILDTIHFPKIRTFDSGRAPDGTEQAGQVLAPIDRETIAERLKTVSADALANDPATLKKRIAELEREARRAVPLPDHTFTQESLNLSRSAGYQEGFRKGHEDGQGAIVQALRYWVTDINTAIGKITDFLVQKVPIKPPSVATPKELMPPRADHKIVMVGRRAGMAMPVAAKANGASPTGLQKKILNALAWLSAKGIAQPSRETLAAVSGVSPSGGYYGNTLGAMRAAGLLDYPQAGKIMATDQGRAHADPPEDNGEVCDQWLKILTGLEREIVSALIEVHPHVMSREELADKIGKTDTGGYFGNTLGHLRTLGAIAYPQKGFVCLTEYVMP